jgi:RNA-binding protein YhbY
VLPDQVVKIQHIMKYVIDKLSDLEIIKVTVSGTLNQDTRKEILSKTVSELNTNGYHRLLIDVTGSKVSQDYKTRTINTFDMVNSIKKFEKKNHTKIAVLSTDIEDSREHFVKLAQFSSKRHIKHLSNYDEAITWLLGGKDIFT